MAVSEHTVSQGEFMLLLQSVTLPAGTTSTASSKDFGDFDLKPYRGMMQFEEDFQDFS